MVRSLGMMIAGTMLMAGCSSEPSGALVAAATKHVSELKAPYFVSEVDQRNTCLSVQAVDADNQGWYFQACDSATPADRLLTATNVLTAADMTRVTSAFDKLSAPPPGPCEKLNATVLTLIRGKDGAAQRWVLCNDTTLPAAAKDVRDLMPTVVQPAT